MQDVLNNLYALNIVTSRDIFNIRRFINRRFPDKEPGERAVILADAVHRIIDGNLHEFGDRVRVRIRTALLERAVARDDFTISAGDVLETALAKGGRDDEFARSVTRWLNRVQRIPISRQWVLDLMRGPAPPFLPAAPLPEPPGQTLASAGYNQTLPGPWPGPWVNRGASPVVWAVSLLLAMVLIYQPLKGFVHPLFGGFVSDGAAAPQPQVNSFENELPGELRYKEPDRPGLRNFLHERNSLLAEEPYFGTIIRTAGEYDINPLLLFAIAGQEQSFVPRDHASALTMANNPFNVYRSWQEYNTDIEDSARIAAVTLVNLSKGRPRDVDPIAWINVKYAEDDQWWIGVSRIFHELSGAAGPD